jgi:oxygen-independent coproporphyrinogen-3 oxidase
LESEIAGLLPGPQEVETIFVGGGTPTQLGPAQLVRLCAIIRRWFHRLGEGEWTFEVNPGTLDEEKADILLEAGVDRVSMGAQSFRAASLEVLERNHGRAQVEEAVRIVGPRFRRWSLDLIFGVPGTTLDDWQSDLEIAVGLGPLHLSCYGLVYEKGTPLWRDRQRGTIRPISEDLERAMFEATIDRLGSAGLPMYEISSYAQQGHECRHNLAYWANAAYFGFGLGAARYIRGVRSVNTRDLAAYLRRVESGEPATGPSEELSGEARARETAMLMLRRTAQGIDRDDFRRRTSFELDALAGRAIDRFRKMGYLEDDGMRVRLSREGIFVADRVMSELL